MFIIDLQVIGPDGKQRLNRVLAGKVMGWRSSDDAYCDHGCTIVTMDSGGEYHVAEAMDGFQLRLRMALMGHNQD